MITHDGCWRVEAGGTGTVVVWYRVVGLDVDRWLPSTPALIAELDRSGVDLADLREVRGPDATSGIAA